MTGTKYVQISEENGLVPQANSRYASYKQY